MIQTKVRSVAHPIPLLSPALRQAMPPCQWAASRLMRIAMRMMPNHVNIMLEPGDLRPGFCYVIAANHQSIMDPFIICSALPQPLWRRLKPFRFFAHNGLFDNWLFGMALVVLGSFPASAHPRYASGIEAATAFLAHRQTVVIFPQGRRRQDKGIARSGVRVLADLPNVAVIPARIEWRRGHWGWPSFRLTVGRPLLEQRLTAQEMLDRVYQLPM